MLSETREFRELSHVSMLSANELNLKVTDECDVASPLPTALG